MLRWTILYFSAAVTSYPSTSIVRPAHRSLTARRASSHVRRPDHHETCRRFAFATGSAPVPLLWVVEGFPCSQDVVVDLSHEFPRGIVAYLVAQPGHKVECHPLAVEVLI